MTDLKQDIDDIRWALNAFAAEERKRNADMMVLSRGCGRPVDTLESLERIQKRLEELGSEGIRK